MTTSRFKVKQVGPYVTFQDGGRPGHMRFGVSASGPMDFTSMQAANLAVGNQRRTTVVEISMGGLALECMSGTVTVAVFGGQFIVELDGAEHPTGTVLTVEAGQQLTIRAGGSGSWCYLAFAGCPQVPRWLGQTATHALSGFGGGKLTVGREFDVTDCRADRQREGTIGSIQTRSFGNHLRIVLGPQEQHFSSEARKRLLNSEFTLSDAYDRMGVRLQGPPLKPKGSLSIPSEPVLKGSVQVSGDGIATILLADHQTTGGYPKIATVISADLDDFVQLRPRHRIRFHPIDPDSAIMLARVRAIELESYFNSIG